MEDDIQSTSKLSPVVSIMAMLGLGIAVIASAIGGVALSKISSTSDDMNARIEKNASFELELKKLSDRIDSLAIQLEDIKSKNNSKVSNLASQTQNAFNTLQSNINELRTEIVKNREGIEKLASQRVATTKKEVEPNKNVAQNETTANNNESQQSQENKTAEGKIYKIQSGDTFAKLAKKFKVSIGAILKANPNVNPSKLKIGQEIVIP